MSRCLKLAWAWPLACVALVGVLHGCGGGTQTASNNSGVGSGGTGSYTNGPISGLGSIIVNGVRYDVDSATVISEDAASPAAADLQIGMVVEVDGGAVTPGTAGNTDTATAARVRYASELVGVVTVLTSDTNGRPTLLSVMGQQVTVNARTVLPQAALNNAVDVVEVHGLPSSSGGLTATRIDVVTPTVYKVSGMVSAVNPSLRTVSIGQGPQVVSYNSASDLPTGVVVGSYVRARVQTTPLAANSWRATGIALRSQLVSEEREGSLEGVIQGYGSFANSGVINGTTVNFTAVIDQLNALAAGRPNPPPNGLHVEVEGQYRSGVLIATSVELDDDSVAPIGKTELHGFVSSYAAGPQRFQLRGITVDLSSAAVDPGLVLANNVCVEVKGTLLNATSLQATEVKRESDCR